MDRARMTQLTVTELTWSTISKIISGIVIGALITIMVRLLIRGTAGLSEEKLVYPVSAASAVSSAGQVLGLVI